MKNNLKHIRIVALTAAALILGGPALAQTTDLDPKNQPLSMKPGQSGPEAMSNAIGGTMAGEYIHDASNKNVVLGQMVWSSDGEELGKVSKVNLNENGNLESIHFEVGTLLGIGGKTVMSEAGNISQNKDRIELKIDANAANALPAIET